MSDRHVNNDGCSAQLSKPGSTGAPDRRQTLLVGIPRRSAELFVSDSDGAAAAGLQAVHEILEAALSQPEHQGDEKQVSTVVDFLVSWRYCPVATASNPSRSCLEDAARQLLAALPAQPPAPLLSDEEREPLNHDAVRILRCPACPRLTVDRPTVVRAASCFNGHEAATYEVIATLTGPLATAAWSLFQVNQLATDEEAQGYALAESGGGHTRESAVYAAMAKEIDGTLRTLASQEHCEPKMPYVCPECDHSIAPGAMHGRKCSRQPGNAYGSLQLRERLLDEAHKALVPGHFDAFKGIVDSVLRFPSDSQGDQERCPARNHVHLGVKECGAEIDPSSSRCTCVHRSKADVIREFVAHWEGEPTPEERELLREIVKAAYEKLDGPDCNPAPTQVEGDERSFSDEDNAELRLGRQPEGGDKEDWPAFVVQRFERDDPIRPFRYVVLDGTQSTDFTNCHEYVPASQDSSGRADEAHEVIGNLRAEAAELADRANKAEAERDRFEKLAAERLERLRDTEKVSDIRCVAARRAETALEELIAEYKRCADKAEGEWQQEKTPNPGYLPRGEMRGLRKAEELAREKAAKLKEGGS